MSRVGLLLQFAALSLFSLAYLTQLSSLTKNYLEYTISSRVELVPAEENYLKLPAFTVCSKGFSSRKGTVKLPNFSKFPREKTEIPFCKVDNGTLKCLYKFLTYSPYVELLNVTLPDDPYVYETYNKKSLLAHFFRSTVDPEVLIRNVSLQSNSEVSHLYYERFYWNSMFCYTINNDGVSIEHNNSNYNLIKVTLRNSLLGRWHSKSSVESYVSRAGSRFNSFDFLGFSSVIDLINNFSLSISYSKYQIKSLPAPYKSRCVNYSDFQLESREDCISRCVLSSYHYIGLPLYNLFDRRRGTVAHLPDERQIINCKSFINRFNRIDAPKQKSLSEQYFPTNTRNEFESDSFEHSDNTYCGALLKFVNCSRLLCRAVDCEKTIYVTSKDELVLGSKESSVSLLMPKDYVLKVELIPGSYFFEFLVAAASTAAFWYGFDVLNLSKFSANKLFTFLSMMNELKKIPSDEQSVKAAVDSLTSFKCKQLKDKLKSHAKLLKKLARQRTFEVIRAREKSIKGKLRRLKLLAKAMVFLLCVLAALGQSYQWTKCYLMYDVQNEVKVDFEDFIRVPFIHLCCRGSEMWKTSSRGAFEKIGSLQNKTPDEILTESTDFFNFLKLIDTLDQSYYMSHTVESKYLRQGYICYVINKFPFNSQLQTHRLSTSILNRRKVTNQQLGSVAVVPVDIFATEVTSFRVYLSEGSDMIQGIDEAFAFVHRTIRFDPPSIFGAINRGEAYSNVRYTVSKNLLQYNVDLAMDGAFTTDKVRMSLNYYTISKRLLGPPYVTDCLDYSVIKFKSRGECYEVCFGQLSRTALGQVPYEISLPSGNATMIQMSKYSYYHLFIDHCRRKCHRPECVSQKFVPLLTASDPFIATQFKMSVNTSTASMFLIAISDTPNLLFDASADLTLTFLITFNLSCLCFWFNLAPVPITLRLIKVLERKKRQRMASCDSIVGQLQSQVSRFEKEADALTHLLLVHAAEERVTNETAS